MEKKIIVVVGGVGEKWGDKQYRQQHRVIDKGMMVTLIAGTHGYAIRYVLRKYEKNKSDSAGRYRTDGERKQR